MPGWRLAACIVISLALNVAFGAWAERSVAMRWVVPEGNSVAVRIEHFVPPSPQPIITPPPRWSRLDRSAIRYTQRFPDHLKIVVQTARQSSGAPSDAPSILRVDLSPPEVHANTIMRIRVLTSADANGVYLRFAVWEIAVPPVAAARFPPSDPDFPGRPYELFARDYPMPPIPAVFKGKAYNVEVVAVGRGHLASATYVPLRLN